MDIKDYAQMMSYLTRPRDVIPEPRPMAQGGRIGFYKGESVVKSHGQQIKELTEAGESSVSIAKKLKLRQQTVNSAINAMDKGIAGEKFKLSKPRSEIIKLAVNETGVNLKDPKYLEEVIKFIDDNPTLNKKEAAKIIGRKRAELVPASSYGNPGKRWNDEKTKLRRDAEKAWTNRYSNISMEDKTRGDKKFHRHHAGSLREKVGTDNTMFIDAQDNYKNIRPFENAINDIQQKQYQTNLNRNMPIETKREIFADLKKQEDALRAANPQFSDYKSTLVFEETPLSKTGYMMKEKMPNPELTVSEGKTGQNIKYKNITPSSDEGKKAIELNKKSIANKLADSGFKCKLSNGLSCNDPRAYIDSIKENMAKVQKGDNTAISKINKLGKSMNKLSKAAKFTGWGILSEVGFAAPFAAIDYAKGANRDEIISNATFGFFGKSKDEQLREKYNDYGQAADFKKTYDDLLTAENLSKTGGGYRTQAYNKLKAEDLKNKLTKDSLQFTSTLPPSQGFKSGFDSDKLLNMMVIDAERDKLFDTEKEQISKDRGILKPSTGLETYDNFMQGGIVSLNVKK
jgi:DNA-binding CsgD family transcriptional regulator